MLLFFTGAEEKNPTYRRGILDGLSYPSGHMLNFSYRRQYIQPALLTRDLRGQRAVIVYVDLDSNGATYMPIRAAQVVKHSTFAGAAERERIVFTFQLGGFVTYPQSGSNPQRHWHEELARYDDNRKVGEHFGLFVIEVAQADFARDVSASAAAWEDVVAAVGRSNQLRNAIFVKLELKNIENSEALPSETMGEQQVYQMRPGTVYALELSVYKNLPADGGPAAEAKVSLSRSSELLEIGQPFQSVVSGLAQQTALISCKRTIEKNLVALGVTTEEPVVNVVNTPHPFFLLRISLPWQDFLVILVFAFLGSFLVALDKDSLTEVLPMFAAQATFLSVVAKFFGAACLALAAFLGLRKLPSGSA
jgi:hypothetical protein